MSYLIQKAYSIDKQVLFNNVNANSLYGLILLPEQVTLISKYRRVLAGTFITESGRILSRGVLLSPYTASDTTIVVNNPYAFKVGDVLYEIGDATENRSAEINAVANASQQFGTVSAIDPASNKQITEITPASIAVGDIFFVWLEGQSFSFVAETTDVADVVKGLHAALVGGMQSHHSIRNHLMISEDGTKITLSAKEPGQIFKVSGSVTGTGTLAIEVTQAVGRITITPTAGNNNHDVGAKIGTIDDMPIGVITHDYYLTDEAGIDRSADLAVYDTANVYKKALVYLDGHIISTIPTLKYTPTYGS